MTDECEWGAWRAALAQVMIYAPRFPRWNPSRRPYTYPGVCEGAAYFENSPLVRDLFTAVGWL